MIGKCIQCGKEGEIQRHHVCYSPEIIQRLCVKCHNKAHSYNLIKIVWITQEAYDYISKLAFDSKLPIGEALSKALLNNVKEESK